MLKEGDLIMHETAGVCRVTGETTLDGLTGVYYILCPLYMKDATFYTPRDNGKVKIRPIMTRDDALTLIDALPTVDSIKFQNFNDQKQRSNEILKSGDSLQLASLTKSLYEEQTRRAKRGNGVGDRAGSGSRFHRGKAQRLTHRHHPSTTVSLRQSSRCAGRRVLFFLFSQDSPPFSLDFHPLYIEKKERAW